MTVMLCVRLYFLSDGNCQINAVELKTHSIFHRFQLLSNGFSLTGENV